RRISKGGRRSRRVKAGPTRGCWMLLDRQFDLQRELGLYETETRRISRRFVHRGTVVLDIGAGDGYESLGYARRGAVVYAFDHDDEAVARFRRNLDLNPGLSDRVTVFEERFPTASGIPSADFAKVDVD